MEEKLEMNDDLDPDEKNIMIMDQEGSWDNRGYFSNKNLYSSHLSDMHSMANLQSTIDKNGIKNTQEFGLRPNLSKRSKRTSIPNNQLRLMGRAKERQHR